MFTRKKKMDCLKSVRPGRGLAPLEFVQPYKIVIRSTLCRTSSVEDLIARKPGLMFQSFRASNLLLQNLKLLFCQLYFILTCLKSLRMKLRNAKTMLPCEKWVLNGRCSNQKN